MKSAPEVIEARRRGDGVRVRVLSARGGEVPYDAMAELIELSRDHQEVREDLLV